MTYAILATVEFDTIGGDPLDKSHNNFVFQSVDASTISDGCVDAFSMLGNFFETLETGQVHVISGYLSAAISRTPGALVRMYDITAHLNGSPHGSPIYTNQFSLTAAASASGLPEGVSSCLSFHSAYGTDVEFGTGTRPRGRDRGRVYLGPLNDNTRALDGTTHRASVASAYRADVALAATALMNADHGAGHVNWAVWSRAAAATKLVSGGWIDDRYDYQRRREDQGLIRTSW